MTPNITAMSSASPPQTSAHSRPKAAPTEEQASASAESRVRIPSSYTPATKTAETPQSAMTTPPAQALTAAVDDLNQHFQSLPHTHLQFSMDDKSGEMVVKVMDVEKEEVIRQIPPEEVLALAAFFKEQTEKEAQGLHLTAPGANGFAAASSATDGLLLRVKA